MVKSRPIVTFDTDPATLRVGQEANFIGRVQGLDWNDTSRGLINLTDVYVTYTLANGTSDVINTDENGTFIIPQYIVPNTNFIIHTTTDNYYNNYASYLSSNYYFTQCYIHDNTSHYFNAAPLTRSPVNVTFDAAPANIRVGQAVNITGVVRGLNASGVLVPLYNVTLYYRVAHWAQQSVQTGVNGVFTIPIASVPSTNFHINYATNVSTNPSLPSLYEDVSDFHIVNAAPLTISNPVNVTFDAAPPNIRVGQAVNITGVVRGLNASGALVPLYNVAIYYTVGGDGQVVSIVRTDVNGVFTIPIASVPSTYFNISYATLVSNNPSLPSLYEDVSGSHIVGNAGNITQYFNIARTVFHESVTIFGTMNPGTTFTPSSWGILELWYIDHINSSHHRLAVVDERFTLYNTRTFNYTFSTNSVNLLGPLGFYFVFRAVAGDLRDVNGSATVAHLTIRHSETIILYDDVNLRIGQAGNITGQVLGALRHDPYSFNILPEYQYSATGLANVTLYYTLANGVQQSVLTDENGRFTIPIAIVPSNSFNMTLATNFSSNPDLSSFYSNIVSSRVFNGHHDYTDLQAAINTANNLDGINYSGIMDTFRTALSNAEAMNTTRNASTQAQIDSLTTALNNCIGLITSFQTATDLRSYPKFLSYTGASMNTLDNAWVNAHNSMLREISQARITELTNALNSAINNLVPVVLNYMDLDKIYQESRIYRYYNIAPGHWWYDDDSYSIFETAYFAADRMVMNLRNASTQEEIDKLTNDLKNAIDGLVIDDRHYNGLRTAINSVTGLNPKSYTTLSWAPLQNALVNAQAMMNAKNATFVDEISNLTNALNDARNNLVPYKVDPIVWFDSAQGYKVGDKFTVYWNLSSGGDLSDTNILAWLILFDYDKPNVELRRAIVTLNSPVNNATVTADGHWNFTGFILPHDRLFARLVIDGRDLNNNFQQVVGSSSGDAETFVYTDYARPVKVSYSFTNVTVGKNYQFAINVTQRLAGAPVIDSGWVNITFDGLHTFLVPVKNGVALFNHTFTQYKLNRFVEVSYIANPEDNLGASSKEKQIFSSFRGTPVATITQMPHDRAAFVGTTVTLQVLILEFAAAADAAPKNVTLDFVSGGKIVHTLVADITPDADFVLADGRTVFNVIASATVQYAYKMPHTALEIRARINDPKGNYNNITTSPHTIIVI